MTTCDRVRSGLMVRGRVCPCVISSASVCFRVFICVPVSVCSFVLLCVLLCFCVFLCQQLLVDVYGLQHCYLVHRL